MTSGPMPSPPMIPARWATVRPFRNGLGHEKTAHAGVDGWSERRDGVRLSNDDDREVHEHEAAMVAADHNDVKPHQTTGTGLVTTVVRKVSILDGSGRPPKYPARPWP